jgi:hypothetical protein
MKLRRRVNLLDGGALAGFTDGVESGSVSPHASSATTEASIANVPPEEDSGVESQLSVESTDEMMVIRLEAVDADNYGSIISALKERGKSWELTNLDGERILKILP